MADLSKTNDKNISKCNKQNIINIAGTIAIIVLIAGGIIMIVFGTKMTNNVADGVVFTNCHATGTFVAPSGAKYDKMEDLKYFLNDDPNVYQEMSCHDIENNKFTGYYSYKETDYQFSHALTEVNKMYTQNNYFNENLLLITSNETIMGYTTTGFALVIVGSVILGILFFCLLTCALVSNICNNKD